MKRTVVAVLTLLIASSVAVSQATSALLWSPPDVPAFDPAPKPTKPMEMVSSLKINGFPVVLEETDLQAVHEHFGAVIGHEGDAADSVQWVCLTGQSAGQRLVLWIKSSEIDGGKVGGFHISHVGDDVQIDRRCRNVGSALAVFPFPKAVHVGMTEGDLINTLGEPTARNPNALFFAHAHKVVIRREPYDSENDIEVLLREGRVHAIQVWKTTSS